MQKIMENWGFLPRARQADFGPRDTGCQPLLTCPVKISSKSINGLIQTLELTTILEDGRMINKFNNNQLKQQPYDVT